MAAAAGPENGLSFRIWAAMFVPPCRKGTGACEGKAAEQDPQKDFLSVSLILYEAEKSVNKVFFL